MTSSDEPTGSSARVGVDRAAEAIRLRERSVRAWTHLDLDDAFRQAEHIDSAPPSPLQGLTFGVKDVFDTAGFPTAYGSAVYAGHRPEQDAAPVTMLSSAGAVCLGKTTTAEFAFVGGGRTVNPHRAGHTPGGSSMGSAAAVAAGMADLALGTQTAASTIRPAAYWGIYGYRSTYGLVPTDGLKLLSPTLDTVGWFARDAETLVAASEVLVPGIAVGSQPPGGVRLARTDRRYEASTETWKFLDQTLEWFDSLEVDVHAEVGDVALAGLFEAQGTVMAFEALRSLGPLLDDAHLMTPAVRQALTDSRRVSSGDYAEALERRERAAHDIDRIFGDADLIVTPAAPGEAPRGLGFTGRPTFSRIWSLLGCPAVSVPGGTSGTGLPIGLQLVARPHDDELLLATVRWMAGRGVEKWPR